MDNFFEQFRKNKFYFLLLIPSLLFITVFVVYPIFYNINLSLRDVTVSTLLTPEWEFIGIDNYLSLIKNEIFMEVIFNSIVFTVGSITFQFIIGFVLAMFLFKTFPGNKFIRTSIIMGWVLSPVVVGTVWRWILNSDYGLLNYTLRNFGIINEYISWLPSPNTAMIGVIIANIWFGIPFNMMLLTGGISGLREDVYEAAKIDGANSFQRFFYLTIPMLKQTIGATLMLGIIYTFKVFALIWVMTGGGPVNATTTLPVWSYQLSFSFFDFGRGAAAANILFIIMGIFALFYINIFGKEE